MTGAAAGIGRAIALRLAAEGARVIVADLDLEKAEVVSREIGFEAFAHRVDVSDEASAAAMIASASEEWGGLDVLVNNAAPPLVGVADRAAYCAAKGGILALTRAAAIDHVRGDTGQLHRSGTVDTPWVQRITSGYEDPEAARQAMEERQPHGRLVSPEEVAAMAAYLASDEAASVIGAAMVVDGGMTAR